MRGRRGSRYGTLTNLVRCGEGSHTVMYRTIIEGSKKSRRIEADITRLLDRIIRDVWEYETRDLSYLVKLFFDA
jgi:hypothetical protein